MMLKKVETLHIFLFRSYGALVVFFVLFYKDFAPTELSTQLRRSEIFVENSSKSGLSSVGATPFYYQKKCVGFQVKK